MNKIDAVLYLLIGAVVIVAIPVLLVGIAEFFDRFSKELRYLNNEVRYTCGAKRRYWIRKRRRLWLSLIPFVKY